MTISRLARLLNRVIGGLSSSARQTQNTPTVFSSEEEGIGKQLQFSSKWYLHARKIPYALHPASQKLPSVAFQTVPVSIRLTVAFSRPFSSASSFHTSLLPVIQGVLSLALCPQVVSQAPQHLRFSTTQTACDSCFPANLSTRHFSRKLV